MEKESDIKQIKLHQYRLYFYKWILFLIIAQGGHIASAQSDPPIDPQTLIWIKIRPGLALTQPDPHVFGKDYPMLQSTNYNFNFGKSLSSKLGVQLDLEYRKLDMEGLLRKRYNFVDINPFAGQSPFKPVKVGNAILSFDYRMSSKNKKSVLDFSLGAGYQRIHRGKTVLAFSNPHRFGAMDTLYEAGEKANGLVGQFGLHYTWYPVPKLGLQLGGRMQLNGTYTNVKYNTIKADANGNLNTKDYCNCETVTGSTIEPIVYIAEVALVLRLGNTDKPAKKDNTTYKPDNPHQNDSNTNNLSCNVSIWPKNINPASTCYDTSTVCFGLNSANHDGQLNIYSAPLDDLSNKRFITSMSAIANQVTITSALFDAGINYFISAEFVHNGTVECAEGCKIPPRCDGPCANTGKGALSSGAKIKEKKGIWKVK